MATRLWGKKVGMTQVFSNNKVIPVTAIEIGNWLITNIKTKERDGYNAVQVGRIKDRYIGATFNPEWLTNLKKYFHYVREIEFNGDIASLQIGQPIPFNEFLNAGEAVDVVGVTIGHGFAGVVKRHNFKGAPGSHGSNMGKRPGSSGSYRSQGRVIKGKRFPGHMGVDTRAMRNLEVISVNKDANVVLIQGSVPGKIGSLLCIRKA